MYTGSPLKLLLNSQGTVGSRHPAYLKLLLATSEVLPQDKINIVKKYQEQGLDVAIDLTMLTPWPKRISGLLSGLGHCVSADLVLDYYVRILDISNIN